MTVRLLLIDPSPVAKAAESQSKPVATAMPGRNYWETKCDGGSALSRSDKQMAIYISIDAQRTITEDTSEIHSINCCIYTWRTWNNNLGITTQAEKILLLHIKRG